MLCATYALLMPRAATVYAAKSHVFIDTIYATFRLPLRRHAMRRLPLDVTLRWLIC